MEAGAWFVLTRSYGCTEIKYLAQTEKLPRVPASPAEYADMMRARGHTVTVGLPTGGSSLARRWRHSPDVGSKR